MPSKPVTFAQPIDTLPDTTSDTRVAQYQVVLKRGSRLYSNIVGFRVSPRTFAAGLSQYLETTPEDRSPLPLFAMRFQQSTREFATTSDVCRALKSYRDDEFSAIAQTPATVASYRETVDAVFTVSETAEGFSVEVELTPFAEIRDPSVLLYVYLSRQDGLTRVDTYSRPRPWEIAIGTLATDDALTGAEIAGSGALYATSRSLASVWPECKAPLAVTLDNRLHIMGAAVSAPHRDLLLTSWGVDAGALRKPLAVVIACSQGALVLRRGVAHNVRWNRARNHTHRLEMSVGGGFAWSIPVLTRPTTLERFHSRIAEVSGLSVDQVRELATVIPELADPAALLARHASVCECGVALGTCGNCHLGRPVPAPASSERRQFSAREMASGWCVDDSHAPPEFRGSRAPAGQLSRFLGVEIETASTANYAVANAAIQAIHATAVHDGSIPSSGIEIVTQPTRGLQFREDIGALCTGLNNAKTRTDKSCGIHVHVDARDLDLFGVQRLTRLWSLIEPAMYDLVAHSRRSSSYARPCADKYRSIAVARGSSELRGATAETLYAMRPTSAAGKRDLERRKKQKYQDSRYNGLNLHSWFLRRTVEFRHHQGSLDATKIIGWAEICGWLIQSAVSMSAAQIDRLTGTPQEVLLSLLPKALRTFAKRRSTVLGRHRPGYKPKVKASVVSSGAPTVAPVAAPLVDVEILPTDVRVTAEGPADIPF